MCSLVWQCHLRYGELCALIDYIERGGEGWGGGRGWVGGVGSFLCRAALRIHVRTATTHTHAHIICFIATQLNDNFGFHHLPRANCRGSVNPIQSVLPPSLSFFLSACLPASFFGHYINPIQGHLSRQRRLDQPLLAWQAQQIGIWGVGNCALMTE